MIRDLSVEALRHRARSVPSRINLELLLEPDQEKMLSLVNDGIDYVSQLMGRNPELKQEHSEDELTIELIANLSCMGFDASHETKIGGHCDIVIKGDDNFIWLGEAKKFDQDYGWLLAGFQQLNTRYSTGSVGQRNGGIIVYVFDPRTDRILCRLGERLVAKISDIELDASTALDGYITTRHPHERTGATFTTRHKAISLLWQPA